MRRRAERVSRPAKEKKRRRRVLVVTICWPRPRRAVQRARLWAITWTASQAALAAMVRLQFQRLPIPVGDAGMIAVGGEEGQLGAGRGSHPPEDEPHRCGAGLALAGGVDRLGYVGGTIRPVGNGSPVHLGYGLDHTAQVLVQADSDGEADPLAPA